MFQAEDWLTPIADGNPSGSDLRNDGRFHAIERLMRPEVSLDRDDQNNPVAKTTVPIDWAGILEQAEALAADGRDLRLLVIVARALGNIDGYAGVAQGLDLIAATLDRYWDSVHPLLRAGQPPRDAALRRINALMQLQNDDDGLLADLSRAAPMTPRGIGPLTGRDLALAMLDQNTILREGPGGLSDKEKAARIAEHDALVQRVKAGCRAEADQNAETFSGLSAAVEAAQTALKGLEARLSEKLDGAAVTFPDLARHLDRVRVTLTATPGGTGSRDDPQSAVTNDTEHPDGPAVGSIQDERRGGAIPDRINTRKDVERCLDLIIEFYERTEPASPLPYLAKRMRRMVPMDFVQLMQEVAPAGLKDFQTAVGAKDDKKQG